VTVDKALFERIRRYHTRRGDDYGSEASRERKYRAILDHIQLDHVQLDPDDTLLDVGCGKRRFRAYVECGYTGIDLVEGVNVMDYNVRHDWVVANGIVYKLGTEREARKVLEKCWHLCEKGFVFTSLDRWAHYAEGELTLDPYDTARWARRVAGKVRLDMSYKPGDFLVAMLR
jgi:hypothetical protein